MRRQAGWGLLLGMVLAVSGDVSSQEPDAGKVARRLPNNYSRIGLLPSQREEIYKVQENYAEKIEALIRQVEDLRKQRDEEIRKVLTDAQRTELDRVTKEMAAASKARKAAAAAKKTAIPE